MPDDSKFTFSAETPYPEIHIHTQNMSCARWMLDNLGGVNSEISAVSLYFYNHLIIDEEYEEIRNAFHQISIVEMHHLDIFGQMALQLGENPRLWFVNRNRKIYWSPSFNQYPTELSHLMHHDLDGEMAAINKYENQLCRINDACVAENLRRIILDEKLHVHVFEQLISEYRL